MKRKLSLYITIKGITIRLKNTSLRTISHVAEKLADLENADELKILITSPQRRCDCILDDADLFVEYIKKIAEDSSRRKKDPVPIDLVIAAIRNDFPDASMICKSNASVTVLSQSEPRKKFKVFAVVSDEIELYSEEDDSQLDTIKFNTIDGLIKHIAAMEYFGL
jgi:hypothetical protein